MIFINLDQKNKSSKNYIHVKTMAFVNLLCYFIIVFVLTISKLLFFNGFIFISKYPAKFACERLLLILYIL